MSYSKAKDSIQQARDLKQDNTRFYREFQGKVRAEVNAIAQDRDLSADGRFSRTVAAKKKHGADLMKQAYTRRQQYLAHLKDAKQHAEAEIYAKIKKPDTDTLERFEASFRKLKTELLLSTNAKTAAAKLTEFIAGVSDPYCANLVHEQFADVAGPIIAQAPAADNAAIRYSMSQTFEGLTAKFESDDVRAARDAIETIDGMETSMFFIPLVRDAVTEAMGKEYGDYVNDTEGYFARHEDERPAALAEPKPASSSVTNDWDEESRRVWREATAWQREYQAQKAAEAAGAGE